MPLLDEFTNRGRALPGQPETTELGRFIEKLANAAVVVATEDGQPGSNRASVTLTRGRLTLTDGPFAETKELLGGVAMIQAQSKNEASEFDQ
jgi:hypothetical protein